MRHTRIAGGELASGSVLRVALVGATPLTLRDSGIGPDRVPEGLPQVSLQASSDYTGTVDIEGNRFVGDVGPLVDRESPRQSPATFVAMPLWGERWAYGCAMVRASSSIRMPSSCSLPLASRAQ